MASAAIYGPVQRIIFHFKIKRGAVGRGTGVMAAAVQLKKLCKAVRLGIFLRPHQRHMFQKMRQPLMICRILQDPTGTTSADSDFTACGSETSSTTMSLSRRIA